MKVLSQDIDDIHHYDETSLVGWIFIMSNLLLFRFWWVLIHFALINWVVLGTFTTILGGWVGGWWEKLRIKTNSAQLKLKLGLSLAIPEYKGDKI